MLEVASPWVSTRCVMSSVMWFCNVSLMLLSIVARCEADGITIVVRIVWLQEERGLSLCRLVVGTIGSTVGLKR